MRESRKFTVLAALALLIVVLLAVVSGKAEAQPLGHVLSQCWGQVQSASIFNWKTWETTPLTSNQLAQVLSWDDSVKFAGTNLHPQFPADTASTFSRFTLNFDTASGKHYADVRVSGDGHAYVFPFRTTLPQGSAWHGCDDLVIPASAFTSLLPQHPERHTTPQPDDSFQCDLVYGSYPAYVDVCYYAPKGG